MIFPVMTTIKNQTPRSLWGTAFAINHTTFLTAKHVVENAVQHINDKMADYIVLGKPITNDIGAHVKVTVVLKYEIHEQLDIAILQISPGQFSDIEISPWIFESLPLLSDVATLGFPYSLDLEAQTIVARGMKGYVSGNGWLFRKFRTPIPESFGHPDRPCSGRASLRQSVRESHSVFEFSH